MRRSKQQAAAPTYRRKPGESLSKVGARRRKVDPMIRDVKTPVRKVLNTGNTRVPGSDLHRRRALYRRPTSRWPWLFLAPVMVIGSLVGVITIVWFGQIVLKTYL